MNSVKAAGLGVTLAAGLTLGGCSTVQKFNPLKKGPDQSQEKLAEKAKRIPLIALDQSLRPADALKDVDFALPAPQAVTDWPLPGGTPEQSIQHVDAAREFHVAWRKKFGKGSSRTAHVTAPPVSAGGKIFVMDGEAEVSALDPATGRVIWKVDLDPKLKRDRHAFGGGLAVADGKLFVTSGYRFVAALDPNSGAELWRQTTASPIHSAPSVAGGRVLATAIDNQLWTFDEATGRPGWTYQALVEPARILAASSAAVSGDAVVASFSSGEIVAVNAANGTELWNQSLTRASRTTALSEIRDIPGRPVIFKGDVLSGGHSGSFSSVDLRTGQLRWDPLPISTITTPWGAGDVVYVTSKAGEVLCLSRDTGQVYWIQDLNAGRKQIRQSRFLGLTKVDRPYWSGVILASNRLISVSSEGTATAMNPKTGEVLSSIKLGSPATLTPIAVGAMVYVVTDDAELVAIR